MKLNIFATQNVAVAYVCLWATAPVLAYGGAYRMAALAAVAVWAALEAVRPGGIFARPTLPVVLAVLFILYTGLIELALGAEGSVTGEFQTWILLFFLIFYESRSRDVRSMAPIFWFIIATLPLWFYTTYNGFDSFGSYAARLQTRSSDEARELASSGVGGYALVYGIVVILPVLAAMLLNVRRIIPIEAPAFLLGPSKIPLLVPGLLLTNLLLGMAVVIRAGFSIAILLAIASLALSLVFRKRSPVFLLFAPLVGAAAYFIMAFALVPILEGLKQLTEGTLYYRKVVDVIATVQNDQAQGTFDERWLRYERSIAAFINNPIFGIINRNVGGHSTYLDSFARYGVFVGSVVVYLLLYLPVRMMRTMRDNFGVALSVFAVMSLLPMLNTMQASFGVMLFVITPVGCDLVERAGARLPYSRPRSVPRPLEAR